MSRLTLGFAGMIAMAGLAASLAIQRSSQARLRARAEALQEQAEPITKLSAENQRLSALVTRAEAGQGLAPDQLRELLRLRGQIGGLRQVAKEEAQLRAANEQLRAGPATAAEELAKARAQPNFWAKEQLAFAGYADPEAALKTLLWAMRNGDMKSYLTSWVARPGLYPVFAMELRDGAEAEMAAQGKMMSDSLAPAIGFHILDKKTKSPDEVILNLSFDGEGKVRRFMMKRTGNEWKMADMLRPGEDEP